MNEPTFLQKILAFIFTAALTAAGVMAAAIIVLSMMGLWK